MNTETKVNPNRAGTCDRCLFEPVELIEHVDHSEDDPAHRTTQLCELCYETAELDPMVALCYVGNAVIRRVEDLLAQTRGRT